MEGVEERGSVKAKKIWKYLAIPALAKRGR